MAIQIPWTMVGEKGRKDRARESAGVNKRLQAHVLTADPPQAEQHMHPGHSYCGCVWTRTTVRLPPKRRRSRGERDIFLLGVQVEVSTT